MPASPFSPRSSLPREASRPVRAPHRRDAALTLVEIVFAIGIFTMVVLGVLQAMLESRRITEGSVRQASIASIVQGYMEQFKSVKFAADSSNALPSSPPSTFVGTSASDWENYTDATTPPILPAKDGSQASIYFYLVPGSAPTSMPDTSTLPTGPAKHTESVDIDNPNSTLDDSTLDMWVWVSDLTDASNDNVTQCKSIVIVYQWTVRDGGRVKTYRDMMRAIRSIVPTA